MKACCTACRPSASARPSTVFSSEPSACIESTVQDLTDLPSRSTVQAPQCELSQPMWVPVRLSVSRMVCTNNSLGSTKASTCLPLRLNETCCFAMVLSSCLLQCSVNGAAGHLGPHMGFVENVSPEVFCGVTDRQDFRGGLFDQCVVDDLAAQYIFRRFGSNRHGRHVGQGDSDVATDVPVQFNNHR